MHLNNNLSKKITRWYDNNKRILPWRVNFNSDKKLYYRILSEFMLQQTQVKTVIPYFNKFTREIKSLKKLSTTSERKVLKLWEGLGYYRRAKNLLRTAKIIEKNKKSILPKNLVEIKKLPGIGDYTGNILLALIYNQPRLGIDGNVKRVISRITNKHSKNINFEEIIEKNRDKLFSHSRNSDFAEAIMEFGALICKPQDPQCNRCPIKKNCKFAPEIICFTEKNFLWHEYVILLEKREWLEIMFLTLLTEQSELLIQILSKNVFIFLKTING